LLVDVDRYFAALTDYRLGRPESIVRRMAEASFSAIGNGRQLVSDLRSTRQSWNSRITARSDASAWRVADLLLQRPVIDSPTVMSALRVPAMTADRSIAALVKAGVLSKVSGRSRNRKYATTEVLAALDAFAARGGRRQRS
jgi:Fic family protein